MPPNQPQNQNSTPASQFDFITNNPQQPQGSRFGMPSFGKRLPFLILGALVGLIIIILVASTIFGGGGGNTAEMTKIMARAQEIARVSELANEASSDADLKDIAALTQTTLISDKTQMLKYLQEHRKKVGAKSLLIYKDAKTDEELTSAAQTNTLDEFYYKYLKEELSRYRQSLATLNSTASESTKLLLAGAYENAGLILQTEQVRSVSSN